MKDQTKHKGYKKIPLTFNRRMVIASAGVNKKKNAIHCITEVDISAPRRLIQEHLDKTGERLSFTAYIVACLVQAVKEYPEFNSFRKGNKLIVFEDVTVSVLIERDLPGEKVPEPLGIHSAQTKTFRQIHDEIRKAQEQRNEKLGSLTDSTWIRWIPNFLLKTFIRIADRNIYMAKRYGKVCVTAVGMYSKEAFWFVPHGTATVLITVGSISEKTVKSGENIELREHLCLTASFDHDIIDGAPASRFMSRLIELIKSGNLLRE